MARTERDWIAWVEFGIAVLEVSLTVFITWMIWREVEFGRRQDEVLSREPSIVLNTMAYSSSQKTVRRNGVSHVEIVNNVDALLLNDGTTALQDGKLDLFLGPQLPDVKISCQPHSIGCRATDGRKFELPGLTFELGTMGVGERFTAEYSISYDRSDVPFSLEGNIRGANIARPRSFNIAIDEFSGAGSTLGVNPPNRK
jgi:hypothetical protein